MSNTPNNPGAPQAPSDPPGYVERYTNQIFFPGQVWQQGTVRQEAQGPDGSILRDKVRGHPVGVCRHPIENIYDLYQCCVCGGITCKEHATQCALCRHFCGICCARQLEVEVQGKKTALPVCLACYIDQKTPRIVKLVRKADSFLFGGGG